MEILNVSIDLNKIDKSKIKPHTNGAKYYSLDIIVNDEPNQYGQDVSVATGQTKEERTAGAKKVFLGNGKVLFGKNKAAAPKSDAQTEEVMPETPSGTDDLPF